MLFLVIHFLLLDFIILLLLTRAIFIFNVNSWILIVLIILEWIYIVIKSYSNYKKSSTLFNRTRLHGNKDSKFKFTWKKYALCWHMFNIKYNKCQFDNVLAVKKNIVMFSVIYFSFVVIISH